jgi:thiol-disulfide isomerase/thioredoxin
MIELLGIFISRHAAFFESYGNLLLIPIVVVVSIAFFIIKKRKLIPGYMKWITLSVLFISNIITGSLLYMINLPLKPMVHSLAKVQRSIGAHLEDFTFKTLSDTQFHSLADYQGKVLVVNFWATYCIPCLEEFPELKKLEETYSGKVEVIALSDEDPDQILKVIQKLNTPSVIGHYKNEKWMNLESFRPVTVILDKEGIIREYKFGRNSLAQFKEMVERYL